jgi:hypothetical protein
MLVTMAITQRWHGVPTSEVPQPPPEMPQDSARWFTYLFKTLWLTASMRSGIRPQDRRNRGTSGVPKGNFFQSVANIWPDGEPPGNPRSISCHMRPGTRRTRTAGTGNRRGTGSGSGQILAPSHAEGKWIGSGNCWGTSGEPTFSPPPAIPPADRPGGPGCLEPPRRAARLSDHADHAADPFPGPSFLL